MSRKRRKNYRKRSRKDRGSSRRVFLGLIFGILALSAVVAAGVYFSRDGAKEVERPPKAAIVDQLGLTYPNPSFVQNTKDTLELAGYQVEYFPGEETDVDFYQHLPTHGYEVLILRVHSAVNEGEDGGADGVSLFTSEAFTEEKLEAYESRYAPSSGSWRSALNANYYVGHDSKKFFGISPEFIRSRTVGKFKGTLVIAMGCDGLGSQGTARAFVEKGAATVIGWDKSVSASHTDTATQQLLQYLFVEKIPPEQATELTMKEVGADPTFGAKLRSYP